MMLSEKANQPQIPGYWLLERDAGRRHRKMLMDWKDLMGVQLV